LGISYPIVNIIFQTIRTRMMAVTENETQPQATSPLVSYHGFVFPFEWYSSAGNEDGFLAGLNHLAEMARCMTLESGWIEVEQHDLPKSTTQYNERNYFYDFVRPALYDGHHGRPGDIVRCYRHELTGAAQYQITTEKKTFKLRIAAIELKLYAIGIGILSLHLLNESPDQADPEDIIEINQYGRRLFPPFYRVDHQDPGADDYYTQTNWNEGLNAHAELPKKIELTGIGQKSWPTTFEAERTEGCLNQIPGLIQFLLPEDLLKRVLITPVLDDRMFVVSWYGNPELAKKCKAILAGAAAPYLTSDWWYRYLFVDGAWRTCQDAEMMEQLLRAHTYTRWSGLGTISGIARYSWVSLSDALPEVPAYVIAHIRTIYFRMVELALLQRACVLRFSEEVTRISALRSGDRHLPGRMERLFREYLRFVNKLNFREVTAQEQGIEMYDMLRRSMRLDEQIKDLDAQIHELHNYAASLGEASRNAKLDLLTLLGAVLGVPTFISTVYGIMEYKVMEHPWWPIMWVYLLSVLFALGIAKAPNKMGRTVFIVLLLGALAIGFMAPVWNS